MFAACPACRSLLHRLFPADSDGGIGIEVVQEFGVEPTSTADALALSEAVLEIAAQPAAYGVDPADAAQVVRLYYAG